MNIDRHNYEEFFQLYIDNELTVEQKKLVELFVKQNPDLEEELLMFKQLKLIPDDGIKFNDKHLLIKDENNSFINLDNYVEWLLLYVDNELKEKEKEEVEKFASLHPQVQQELDLFLQTRLQPEEIVFGNKEILYKEQVRVRIISIQWWRAVAAAILIVGVGLTLYSVLYNRNDNHQPGTKNDMAKINEQKIPHSENSTVKIVPNQNNTIPGQGKEVETKMGNTLVKAGARNSKSIIAKEIKTQSPEPSASRPQLFAEKQKEKQKVDIITDAVAVQQTMPPVNQVTDLNEKINNPTIIDPAVTKTTPETPEPKYANNTDKRLRGFFRKATRIIEHTTNINPADDDNRVLIGGMAINLK